MKRAARFVLAIILALSLALSACSPGAGTGDSPAGGQQNSSSGAAVTPNAGASTSTAGTSQQAPAPGWIAALKGSISSQVPTAGAVAGQTTFLFFGDCQPLGRRLFRDVHHPGFARGSDVGEGGAELG